MPKPKPANGEYYHLYNRGVDKRKVFLNDRDYERFTFLLFACNDPRPFLNSQFHYRGLTSIEKLFDPARRELVDLVSFCLMPNHFHLLVRQKMDNGIPLFMQKLTTGYSMYFNQKQERSGALFQGTYKAIHIDNDMYLKHLTRYVHLNPAELVEPGWKEHGIKNLKAIHDFVSKYYWSSYADYLCANKFPRILNNRLIRDINDSSNACEIFVKSWLAKDFAIIKSKVIEV